MAVEEARWRAVAAVSANDQTTIGPCNNAFLELPLESLAGGLRILKYPPVSTVEFLCRAPCTETASPCMLLGLVVVFSVRIFPLLARAAVPLSAAITPGQRFHLLLA